MGKRMCVLIALLFLLPLFTLHVRADSDQTDIINQQSEKSGASGLYGKAPDSAKKSLGELHINQTNQSALSNFTPAGLFKLVAKNVREAATAPLKALMAVFGILLICALLNTMKNSFGEKPLSTVFGIVCTLCIATVLLLPVTQCIHSAAGTVEQTSGFMLTFLPVFVSLVAASGHPASAVAYQGLLMVSSQLISQIASTTLLPMVDMYLAFCVIGSISPGIKIGGIASFIRKITNFALTLCLTVFTGILTVQGLIAQAADSVTTKTAKFLVDSAVPVIGGVIKDAVTTVASCANLLKTTTGAFAIVVFILAYLPPILSCIMWILAADLSVVAAEMLGVDQITGLLKAVKEALRLLIALILSCALAMIISVSVMLLLGMNS